jgi:hypothetical protein
MRANELIPARAAMRAGEEKRMVTDRFLMAPQCTERCRV